MPGPSAQLRDVGELALVADLLGAIAGTPDAPSGAATGVEVGPGDDAAVFRTVAGTRLALTTDAVVEGRHFDRAISDPEDWGWKAVAVNVSDVVAMGGIARWVVIALVVPADRTVGLVERVYRGVAEAAAAFGVTVVGGDTCAGGVLVLAVTALGEVDRPVRRDGARAGDRLVLTGPVGAAAAGLGLLRLDTPAAHAVLDRYPGLAAAHRRPTPDPAAGPRLAAAGAHAMLDVSDGVGADALRLAEQSGVGIELVDAAVPLAPGVGAAAEVLDTNPVLLGLAGGEDFVLAAALPQTADLPGVVECGRFTDRPGEWTRRTASGTAPLGRLGWDHFAAGPAR